MKLSILDPVQIPVGQTSGEAMRGSIALAQATERLGYHRYWLVEHHDVPYEANPAPEVLATALACATTTIRIGVGGLLLNHYSPYKSAEAIRTLAVLFPGRIDVGIGRATAGVTADTALKRHRDVETPDDHDSQTEEFVGWLGNDLPPSSPFNGIGIMPDEAAGPLPWVLAATEGSARRAARLGLPMACSAFHVPENAPATWKAYHENFQPSRFAAGVDAPTSLLAIRLIVGETQEEAERLAMPMRTAFKLRRKNNIMLTEMPTPEEAIAIMGEVLPAEDADWPAYVIGTPERVKAVVERMARDTGATEIMVQDVLHDAALRHRNYELLARTFDLTPP
ncbi:luciferase family oxidoreductase group 1 [Mycoplana sp. BE70]|uniref:MsnO8 family LLM class oxidoreductase n=1 Tax=Mycoplana sp. BE70 TaxID=2817775 RepID=UPI00285E4785|nr:MsnO8 family LLM class oxidoreductase [Mycoplana sp. BE70]MDR6755591.1 luciferase family oxidoreductase group 1 [Mycoplana sp. BE70]